MLDRLTRPLKDKLLYPFAKATGRYLSPNSITLLSFLIGLGSVYFVLHQQLVPALILWILNRISDGLDGAVSRVTGRQSDFGGYMDILSDFILYALIPLVFTYTFGQGEGSWISLAVMLSLFYINSASWMFLSALLEKRNAGSSHRGEQTSVTMPAGIVEGTETIIFFTLFYLFPRKIDLIYGLMSISLIPGIVFRIYWAWKNLK